MSLHQYVRNMSLKRNKTLIILFLLLLIFFLFHFSNKITISRDKALSDFNFLVSSIEENFPGTYHIDANKKKKLKKSYNETVESISNKKDLDLYYFYNLIDNYLKNYSSTNGPLGHLYLLRAEDLNYLKSVENFIPKFSINNSLNQDSYNTYKYISKKDKFSKINFFTNSKNHDKNLEFQEDDNFILISIKSFDHRLKNKDLKIMQNLINEDNCQKSVIIDLSNCIGGSDYYWIDNFIKTNMYPKNRLYSKKDKALFLDGKLVKAYLDFFEKSPDYIVKNINSSNLKINNNFKYLVEMSKADCVLNTTYTDKLFKGEIYVFYGKNTSSSAEGFLEFLKFNKLATLCGNNSKGNNPFVQPLFLNLPNSNFIVRFQVDYRIDENNKAIWEKGINPDLYFNNISELEKYINKKENKF